MRVPQRDTDLAHRQKYTYTYMYARAYVRVSQRDAYLNTFYYTRLLPLQQPADLGSHVPPEAIPRALACPRQQPAYRRVNMHDLHACHQVVRFSVEHFTEAVTRTSISLSLSLSLPGPGPSLPVH